MNDILRQHRSHLSLVMFLVLLATTIAAWRPMTKPWMQQTSQDAGLVLSHVTIAGISRTLEADVQAVLDVDTGMPLMSVELPVLQERIERLPWIERAEITRHMSGELAIMVYERVPFALQQTDGEVWLIDASGARITDRALSQYEELPLIVGDVAASDLESVRRYAEASEVLSQKLKSSIRVDDRRWDLVFENGIRVKMADDDNKTYGAQQSWDRLVELDVQHQLLRREVSVVDLRLEGRLVVRLTPEGRKRMSGSELAL